MGQFKPFALILLSSVLLVLSASACTDMTNLIASVVFDGDICSSAAFTSGDGSTVNGNITAVAAVTLGANSIVNGNITAGEAFTSGDGATVNGNIDAGADRKS